MTQSHSRSRTISTSPFRVTTCRSRIQTFCARNPAHRRAASLAAWCKGPRAEEAADLEAALQAREPAEPAEAQLEPGPELLAWCSRRSAREPRWNRSTQRSMER